MSDEIREQLSALMDGELPRDQVRFLLRRIDGDVRLAQTWARYQLAGSALRRQTVMLPLRAGFADAVMQQVGEPGIGMRVMRWAGGGAIAAAVAVLALVSTRPLTNTTEPAAVLASVPSAAAAAAPAEATARTAMPSLPLQPVFDFAQPASFDKDGGVIPLPRYRREQPVTLGPYVLLTVPPAQRAESPPR